MSIVHTVITNGGIKRRTSHRVIFFLNRWIHAVRRTVHDYLSFKEMGLCGRRGNLRVILFCKMSHTDADPVSEYTLIPVCATWLSTTEEGTCAFTTAKGAAASLRGKCLSVW